MRLSFDQNDAAIFTNKFTEVTRYCPKRCISFFSFYMKSPSVCYATDFP